MRRNDERRRALLDAAVEVLAAQGARGLTFRAVDGEARVPVGTASNYFANRDDLFTQIASRIYDRLLPDPVTVTHSPVRTGDADDDAELMRVLVERVTGFRSGQLALVELRLEATRRPALRAVLTARVRQDIDANAAHHEEAGSTGGSTAVLMLYLSLNWLILERLTLPDLLSEDEIGRIVTAAIHPAPPAGDGTVVGERG